MVTYRFLGTGVTDASGVARLTKDPQGQTINGYTGSGIGEVDFIASLDNPISDESIVSQEYPVWDTLVHDENLTASKIYNYNLEDRDFYCEFIVHPLSSIDSRGLLAFSQDANNVFTVGDLYSSNNNNCGINWTGGTFYGKQIPVDEDTKVTVTRTGTNIILKVGVSTYTISDMGLELNTLTRAIVENNSIKNFMLYLVPQTDRISIKASANTIQTDDTATITGRLHYNSEIVKNTNLDVYKNGSKVGTANTGSTGVASYSYTGVGAGATEFQFKYGILVSETYEVWDYVKYDSGIDGTATDIYDARSDARDVFTRTSEYSSLTEKVSGTNAQLWLSSIPNDCIIDLELCQVDGLRENAIFSIYQNTTYKTTFSLQSLGFTSSVVGEWHKFRIDLRTEGYLTITDLEDNTKTYTNPTAFTGLANRLGLITSNEVTEIRIRNVKVYPI